MKNEITSDDQLVDIEIDRLIEHSKMIGQNERQSLKHKTEVKNLLKLYDDVIILLEMQKEYRE